MTNKEAVVMTVTHIYNNDSLLLDCIKARHDKEAFTTAKRVYNSVRRAGAVSPWKKFENKVREMVELEKFYIYNTAVDAENRVYGRDHFVKFLTDAEEARHWVINHLDLSEEWKIEQETGIKK